MSKSTNNKTEPAWVRTGVCPWCGSRAIACGRCIMCGWNANMPDHDGETYESVFDKERLNAQQRRVFEVMQDGRWRTLREISETTGDGEASISARLRDFRKEKFGGFAVDRRRRGEEKRGLFEYRLDMGGGQS